MTQKSHTSAATNLRTVINEGTNTLERVIRTTKRLSLEGTATLIGTFGGLLGLSAAYSLTILVPSVSLAFAGPVALGLGITGGLLGFRGSGAAKLDREIDHRHRSANYLLEQITQLPKSAPKEIKEGLYLQYHSILTGANPPIENQKLLPSPDKVLLNRP